MYNNLFSFYSKPQPLFANVTVSSTGDIVSLPMAVPSASQLGFVYLATGVTSGVQIKVKGVRYGSGQSGGVINANVKEYLVSDGNVVLFDKPDNLSSVSFVDQTKINTTGTSARVIVFFNQNDIETNTLCQLILEVVGGTPNFVLSGTTFYQDGKLVK